MGAKLQLQQMRYECGQVVAPMLSLRHAAGCVHWLTHVCPMLMLMWDDTLCRPLMTRCQWGAFLKV